MNRKSLLAAALAAGSLMGLASVAQAVPAVVATPGAYAPGTVVYGAPSETVIVRTAPPAPLVEAVPAPRSGYVWTPGHYEWRHGRYLWVAGEWMGERPGYAWREAHWRQRPDGSWVLMAGHWVPNDHVAYEHHRRGPMGDRDGDGVPNRYDDHPRNPYRD